MQIYRKKYKTYRFFKLKSIIFQKCIAYFKILSHFLNSVECRKEKIDFHAFLKYQNYSNIGSRSFSRITLLGECDMILKHAAFSVRIRKFATFQLFPLSLTSPKIPRILRKKSLYSSVRFSEDRCKADIPNPRHHFLSIGLDLPFHFKRPLPIQRILPLE